MPPTNAYDPSTIMNLDPRAHVRKRPGMYIGGTDQRALHHLVWIGMDYPLEEAMVGHCHRIQISIDDDNRITIDNDGLGLPIETITEIMTGVGVREPLAEHYYGIQGGVHGIGLSVLNILAETCEIEIRREGAVWQQAYALGLPTTELKHVRQLSPFEKDGIRLTFKPDFAIFEPNDFDFGIIANRCQDIAYLLPQVSMTVDDRRGDGRCELFHAPDGLSEWVQMQAKDPIHEVISGKHFMELSDYTGKTIKVGVDFAFQFTESREVIERSFINSVPTPEGGTHIEGLHQALLEIIFPDAKQRPKWQDMEFGFVGAIHALHPDPQWVGRMTLELRNPEVHYVAGVAVKQMFAEKPNVLQVLRDQIVLPDN